MSAKSWQNGEERRPEVTFPPQYVFYERCNAEDERNRARMVEGGAKAKANLEWGVGREVLALVLLGTLLTLGAIAASIWGCNALHKSTVKPSPYARGKWHGALS